MSAKRIFDLDKYVLNKCISELNKDELYDEFFVASSDLKEALIDFNEIIEADFNLEKESLHCKEKMYSIYGYDKDTNVIVKIEDSVFRNL